MEVVIDYVSSDDNVADVFTKPPKRHLLVKFGQFLFGQ